MAAVNCFKVRIVSQEESLFAGEAQKLFVSGVLGQLEVLYGHAPLLTKLQPGPVWVVPETGKEDILYVSGGILEVQPTETILLADVAIRAADVDEVQALEAKKRAEQVIATKGANFDYEKAHVQLTEALAKLRVLQKLKEYRDIR